jgi:hypothetical protein
MPLPAIRQLLGHADIATTTTYIRVWDEDLARMTVTSESLFMETVMHLSTLQLGGSFLNTEPFTPEHIVTGNYMLLSNAAYHSLANS